MPKKFVGENSKAVVAKARKAEAKNAQDALKKKLEEDASWEDNNKQIVKKQQKQVEQEKKKQELLEKKAQNKALLQQELESIKTQGKQPLAKITRAQVEAETAKRNMVARPANKADAPPIHAEKPLEENINRFMGVGEVANTIDEAISILKIKDEDVDMHPEKRMKAAYTAYEAQRLPVLKAENPSLRLTQLKQLLFKEWQKSPENPLNQKS